MNRFPFTATGIAHSWVCSRNGSRDKSEGLLYDEMELSELLMIHDLGLMGIYFHWNDYGPVPFLQADAICIHRNSHHHYPKYFVLAFPSRYTCRKEDSLPLSETIGDDIVLHFDRKDENSFYSPTWIAAVYGNKIVEIEGEVIDYSGRFRIMLPTVLYDYSGLYRKAYYDDLIGSGESHWKALLEYLKYPGINTNDTGLLGR